MASPQNMSAWLSGIGAPGAVPPSTRKGYTAPQIQAMLAGVGEGLPLRDAGGPVGPGQAYVSGVPGEELVAPQGGVTPVHPGVNVAPPAGGVVVPRGIMGGDSDLARAAIAGAGRPGLSGIPNDELTTSELGLGLAHRADQYGAPPTEQSAADKYIADSAKLAGVAPPKASDYQPHGWKQYLLRTLQGGMAGAAGYLTRNPEYEARLEDQIANGPYREAMASWQAGQQQGERQLGAERNSADFEQRQNQDLLNQYNEDRNREERQYQFGVQQNEAEERTRADEQARQHQNLVAERQLATEQRRLALEQANANLRTPQSRQAFLVANPQFASSLTADQQSQWVLNGRTFRPPSPTTADRAASLKATRGIESRLAGYKTRAQAEAALAANRDYLQQSGADMNQIYAYLDKRWPQARPQAPFTVNPGGNSATPSPTAQQLVNQQRNGGGATLPPNLR